MSLKKLSIVAAVSLLALSLLGWALVSVNQSSARADRAAAAAAEVQRNADKAAADRAAADKEAADKAADELRLKKVADAAVKKALADKAAADKKAAKSRPAPKAPAYGPGVRPQTGGAYGTFGLTSRAYPGPVYVRSAPRNSASRLYPVYPSETITVYCSVSGQNVRGISPYWDWTGDGWIWDKYVSIGGHTPPSC